MSEGLAVVVATLDRDRSGRESLIVHCPLCDRMHRHGASGGYGARLSHCALAPRIYQLVERTPYHELHGCAR